MLNNFFYILIFINLVGTFLGIMLMIFQRVSKSSYFIANILCITFYIFPFVKLKTHLVSPEETVWISIFQVCARMWLVGCILLFICFAFSYFRACSTLKRYSHCSSLRVTRIYQECCENIGVKKHVDLVCSTEKDLDTPACVISVGKRAIIISEKLESELTDDEIKMVLLHELNHIKRGHLLLRKLVDIITILHWMNPFIWIYRKYFYISCECDCDKATVDCLEKNLSIADYTTTIMKLLQLSIGRRKKLKGSIGTLDFVYAKKRFQKLYNKPTLIQKRIVDIVLLMFIIITILLSFKISSSYFYPYQNRRSQISEEWSK